MRPVLEDESSLPLLAATVVLVALDAAVVMGVHSAGAVWPDGYEDTWGVWCTFSECMYLQTIVFSDNGVFRQWCFQCVGPFLSQARSPRTMQ